MDQSIKPFIRQVMCHYVSYGRHELPWRHTDAYGVLVSEIMLQQTQVDRVVPFFERWMRKFPTPQQLAKAPLADVLKEWNGLGYNRRAKMLHECAKEIMARHGGAVPRNRASLEALPGIGPYTAGAIRAFAFDEKEVFVETNIRAVLIHLFFPKSKKVDDKTLIPFLEECLIHAESARTWYSALMDYGTHIKKTHPNPSRRSKHHVRQSKFEGSLRQARGAVLRQLLKGPVRHAVLLSIDTKNSHRIEGALKNLASEGLIKKRGASWRLAS